MTANTKIEWADHTFNPWIGCTRVSPACDDCYAARSTPARAMGITWGAGQQRHRTAPSTWRQPITWNNWAPEFFAQYDRRQRVFCASLADVFDNEVPPEWRADLFRLIEATPQLDWLLLTKRIGNARDMMFEARGGYLPLLPNVWIGATVVNQEEADRDIPKLLQVPAAKRFLSIEPMLGPISLRWLPAWPENAPTIAQSPTGRTNHLDGLRRLDWIIAGGESGPKARPTHPDSARSLREQCAAAGVPFLWKQWGEWLPINQQEEAFTNRLYRSNRKAKLHEDQGNLDDCYGRTCTVPQAVVQADGTVLERLAPMAFRQGTESMLTFKVGKAAAGRLLDGVEHNGFPS